MLTVCNVRYSMLRAMLLVRSWRQHWIQLLISVCHTAVSLVRPNPSAHHWKATTVTLLVWFGISCLLSTSPRGHRASGENWCDFVCTFSCSSVLLCAFYSAALLQFCFNVKKSHCTSIWKQV